MVDHIDGDKTNNIWSNLKEVSASGNMRNTRLRRNNKSGHVGVWFEESRQKWVAEIVANDRKKRFLGRYDRLEDAISARQTAQGEYGYSERHGTTHLQKRA
jgi:hypothetical protein